MKKILLMIVAVLMSGASFFAKNSRNLCQNKVFIRLRKKKKLNYLHSWIEKPIFAV